MMPTSAIVTGGSRGIGRAIALAIVAGFCLAAAAGDLGDLTFKVVCGVSEQTRARLTAIAAEYGLSDRVEILGFVTDAQVAHLTRTARDCPYAARAVG